MKLIVILGGPNGVGKSITGKRYAQSVYPGIVHIDGDRVAKELEEHGGTRAMADKKIRDMFYDGLDNGKNILLESNLTTQLSYLFRDMAKNRGYETKLEYYGVDNLDLLNDRIKERRHTL